jgi:hypothetical protein
VPPDAANVGTVPIGYLLVAIGGLTSACGVLFWQLIAAKREALDLAKEVIPVATLLQKTVEGLMKIVERLERELEARKP